MGQSAAKPGLLEFVVGTKVGEAKAIAGIGAAKLIAPLVIAKKASEVKAVAGIGAAKLIEPLVLGKIAGEIKGIADLGAAAAIGTAGLLKNLPALPIVIPVPSKVVHVEAPALPSLF